MGMDTDTMMMSSEAMSLWKAHKDIPPMPPVNFVHSFSHINYDYQLLTSHYVQESRMDCIHGRPAVNMNFRLMLISAS